MTQQFHSYVYTQEKCHTKTRTRMFTMVLFTVVEKGKQLQYLLSDELIKCGIVIQWNITHPQKE